MEKIKKNKRHGTQQYANLCKTRLLSDLHNRKQQNTNKWRLIWAGNLCSIVIPSRATAVFTTQWAPVCLEEGRLEVIAHHAATPPPPPDRHPLLRLPQSSGNRVPFPTHIQDGNADWHVNSARQRWRQTSAVSPQQHTALVKTGWKMFLYYRFGNRKTKTEIKVKGKLRFCLTKL